MYVVSFPIDRVHAHRGYACAICAVCMLHLTRFRVRDFYIRKSFRFYRVQRVRRINPIF